jgi:hypothetical protein
MLSITRQEVPEYLRTGELYASLNAEDGEPFQVLSSATKRNPEVLNLENLRHLLESLRYWVIKDPLEVVITYVLSETSLSVEVGFWVQSSRSPYHTYAYYRALLQLSMWGNDSNWRSRLAMWRSSKGSSSFMQTKT